MYALSRRGWDAELVAICKRRMAELQRRERWLNRDDYLRWQTELLAKLQHASGTPPAPGGGSAGAVSRRRPTSSSCCCEFIRPLPLPQI